MVLGFPTVSQIAYLSNSLNRYWREAPNWQQKCKDRAGSIQLIQKISGDPAKLRQAGVEPKVDLPGVGLNFQDHYLTFSTFRAKPNVESFDDFVRGDSEAQQKAFAQWNLNGTGPLATNGIDAGVKVRPTEQELKHMDSWPFPEFGSGWNSYFKNKPDKPVMHYSVISG